MRRAIAFFNSRWRCRCATFSLTRPMGRSGAASASQSITKRTEKTRSFPYRVMLFEGDGRASLGELFLQVFGLVLGSAFLDDLRRGVNHVLSLL